MNTADYGLTLVTAPASEPVTLAEMKLFSRVDTSADDDLITANIEAARQFLEDYTQRAFINTTYDLTVDRFAQRILIPRSPLSSVTSISYVDTSGNTSVVASSVYRVVTGREPGYVELDYGQTWPTIQSSISSAVTIRFVAGYGADATAVKERIKLAIKHVAADMYEHRETNLDLKFISQNRQAMSLLSSFQVAHQGDIL